MKLSVILKIVGINLSQKGKIHTLSINKNVKLGRSINIASGCVLSSSVVVKDGVRLSKNVLVGCGTIIGYYSAINRNTIIDYADIGNFCSIGPNCHIGPGNHAIEYVSTSQRFYAKNNILGMGATSFSAYSKKCRIGNDVWIGTGVIIMQGVSIGDGAVIGAGSVVTKDVPPYCIYVGNPARLLKKRFTDEQISYLTEADLFSEEYKNKLPIILDLVKRENKWFDSI